MYRSNFLERIIRLLPDGVFAIDITGNVIVWNRALEEMTGIKENDMIGKNNFEYAVPFYGFRRPMPVDYIINPDILHSEHWEVKNDCIEVETFIPLLYRSKGAWVKMTATCIVDEECNRIGAVQIVRDITEIKNRLTRLKNLFKVFEQAPVGIAILKFSGEITYCNKTFLTYTGLDRSEDKNIYEIFSQISLYEIHNGYIKEIKLNGKIFRIRAIKLNHEEIYGYAVFLTDITELRKYEEQIIIANKMEAVRKLTSTYTHEIKNMLTGIKGFAQLAMQRENIEEAREHIGKLIAITDSLLANIKEILGSGRDVGKNTEIIDIKDVIKNLLTFLKASLRDNINLTVDFEQKPLTVFVDKTDIEKIITNIVLNAQDAMPEGGQITIKAGLKFIPDKFKNLVSDRGDFARQYIYLTITDTGIGMDSETKERIFEPFFTIKGEKGSGIGLTTVYNIVQKLRGFIFVESEPQRGTKFEIYIPSYPG